MKSSMQVDQAVFRLAQRLFPGQTTFVAGVAKEDQIRPSRVPEVAFAGRSNVGKSSLLNAVTGQNKLAHTSATPGRTREINFFSIADRLMLVDLPGYGYARISKSKVEEWGALIEHYLLGRPNLKRVFLLIDARHGMKDSDHAVMQMMDDAAVTYQLVLTKTDKQDEKTLVEIVENLLRQTGEHPAMHPTVLCTSARERKGIEDIRLTIAELAAR